MLGDMITGDYLKSGCEQGWYLLRTAARWGALGVALVAGVGADRAAAQDAPDAVFRAGQAMAARGDRAGASREFERALTLYAQLVAQAATQHRALPAGTLERYAFALAAVGQLPEATVQMKAASAAEPKNPSLRSDLGSLYAQQGEWALAEPEFRSALRLAPLNPEVHLRLGLALRAQGKPGALEEIAQAAKLAPRSEEIALQYGSALAGAGDDAQAIVELRKLLASHPQNLAAMDQLALALQRTDKPDQAIPLFQKVLLTHPDDADVLTNLGMALTQERRAKDAVPVLQKAVAVAPQKVTALEDLAAAYVQLNQFGDAVTQLQAALQLAPEMPQLHYDLGLAYKMQDDAAHAIPELERAEALDPKAPEAPLALGMLYLQGGRYEDAARELKTSLTMRPQNGEGWATLGSVYSRLDRLPEAEAALDEAIRQLQDQPDPHLTLAAVYVKESKPAEAAAERKKAADLMRSNMNHQRAEVATHAGEGLLKSGDVAGAVADFQEALSFDPAFREAHEDLARAFSAQGRRAEAAEERSKAAAIK